MNNNVSNQNDFKVVDFTNKTSFDFTPEMGCMYDGRPIFGISGSAGIKAGEKVTLPFHVGNLLAKNLAKAVMVRNAPADVPGVPTGQPIWDDKKLDDLKLSFLTELYSEAKPVAKSETDRLFEKVEEYRKMVENLSTKVEQSQVQNTVLPEVVTETGSTKVYQDKGEVIVELTKRGIKFDARQNKASLEKLLV